MLRVQFVGGLAPTQLLYGRKHGQAVIDLIEHRQRVADAPLTQKAVEPGDVRLVKQDSSLQ